MSTTPKPHDAQERRDKYRERQAWIEAVFCARLSPNVRLVAVRLACHLNLQDRRCNPSYRTLATEVRISERSAMRAAATLAANRWISIEHSAGGSHYATNNFRLLPPPTDDTGVTPGVTPASPERVTKQAVTGDSARHRRVTELCHPNTESNIGAPTEPPILGERVVGADAPLAPDLGGGRLEGGPPDHRKQETKKSLVVDRFGELHALWDRGHPGDNAVARVAAARAAFTAACRDADADQVIEAARAWVAAKEATDGVRYLPRLEDWLPGWRKLPPKRARQQQQRRRGEISNGEAMLIAGDLK